MGVASECGDVRVEGCGKCMWGSRVWPEYGVVRVEGCGQ